MHQEPHRALGDHLAGSGPPAALEPEGQLATVPLNTTHRTKDFICNRSVRVARFIRDQAPEWVARRLCGVFVLPDPDDPTHIVGFYTLSQYVLTRDNMTRSHRDTQLVNHVPLALIGFMGKHDGTPPGIGAALVVDAARRAYQQRDIPTWGMAVEPEGGEANARLWTWYKEECRFIPARTVKGLMYGPYKNLIPELSARSPAAIG